MKRSVRIWFCVVGVLAVAGVVIVLSSVPSHRKPYHAAPHASVNSVISAPLGDQVTLTSPKAGSTVTGSFDVSGQAPNEWFFEAQFPIQVRDANNNVIGHATGHTDGDWTVEGILPFMAHVELDADYHGQASLVLLKDNPSGLPERDDAVSVPIVIN